MSGSNGLDPLQRRTRAARATGRRCGAGHRCLVKPILEDRVHVAGGNGIELAAASIEAVAALAEGCVEDSRPRTSRTAFGMEANLDPTLDARAQHQPVGAGAGHEFKTIGEAEDVLQGQRRGSAIANVEFVRRRVLTRRDAAEMKLRWIHLQTAEVRRNEESAVQRAVGAA